MTGFKDDGDPDIFASDYKAVPIFNKHNKMTESDELMAALKIEKAHSAGTNAVLDHYRVENTRLKAELAALKQQHKCTSRCQISGCADADKYMGDSVPRAGGAINYSEGVIKIPAKIDDALFRWEQYAFHRDNVGDIKKDELRRCLNELRAATKEPIK